MVSEKRVKNRPPHWFRSRFLPVFSLLLAIAIVSIIFLTYGRHPERLAELKNLVYGGAFLISLIGNATIILPGAVLVILAGIGSAQFQVTGLMGPLLVGLAGGMGAVIGETTGYAVGYGGRLAVERRETYRRVARWMKRWGALAIFLFSVVPFVFDLVGIAAGTLRYPFWKFLFFCWLGRTLLYTVLIVLVALGWDSLLPYFS